MELQKATCTDHTYPCFRHFQWLFSCQATPEWGAPGGLTCRHPPSRNWPAFSLQHAMPTHTHTHTLNDNKAKHCASAILGPTAARTAMSGSHPVCFCSFSSHQSPILASVQHYSTRYYAHQRIARTCGTDMDQPLIGGILRGAQIAIELELLRASNAQTRGKPTLCKVNGYLTSNIVSAHT